MSDKLLIIINTVLVIFALVQFTRSIYKSKLLEAKLNASTIEVEKLSLEFIFSEDRQLLQKISRFVVILLIINKTLVLIGNIQRIIYEFTIPNFVPYPTILVGIISLIYSIITAIIAHMVFMIFDQADFKPLFRVLDKIKSYGRFK